MTMVYRSKKLQTLSKRGFNMSKRSEGLGALLAVLNDVETRVNNAADEVIGVIEMVKDKVEDQYDQAVASSAVEEEAERRARETVNTVFGFVKNNPTFKTFFDTVVNPAKTPGDAVQDSFEDSPWDFPKPSAR